MDLEQQERVHRAIAELADDDEFGQRWHLTSRAGNRTEQIERYFRARGVSDPLATYLALAYVSGALHAIGEFDQSLERLGL